MPAEIAPDAQIAIVGAGLAGLRTAEALRRRRFAGSLVVIGDEIHPPYNRPPLSKEALAGGIEFEALMFRQKNSDLTWRLGSTAIGCTPEEVLLADGSAVPYDGLVIASGIRPRHLPVPGPQPLSLRTLDDAVALRDQLAPGASLLIVGAGFIGCEVAATARSLGCEVTVTAFDAEPMIAALGVELAAAMRAHHEAHGVRFVLGVGVAEFMSSGVTLDDGTVLEADVVLEAVGSVPNTEWLSDLGLDLSNGVLCDNDLRALGADRPTVAVGDIARFPNPRFDDEPRRIEHWSMPADTARRAAETLLADLTDSPAPAEPFAPIPSFWSDQYDWKLESQGMPALGDAVLIEGSWEGECIVEYRHDERLVGVIGVNRTREVLGYRDQL